MQFTNVNFISANQCPYTIDGRKLIEMRKAALAQYAESLGVSIRADTSKNDVVVQMMTKLEAMGAPYELNDIKKKAKKK